MNDSKPMVLFPLWPVALLLALRDIGGEKRAALRNVFGGLLFISGYHPKFHSLKNGFKQK